MQTLLQRKTTEVEVNPFTIWQELFDQFFDLRPNLSDLALPDKSGYIWPIVSLPEISTNRLWSVVGECFPSTSSYGDDLEAKVTKNDRFYSFRQESCIIAVRPNIEADEDQKSKSADQIKQEDLATLTLYERMLLEFFHWFRTGGENGGQHLDRENWSLCSGSRDSDGNVPCAYWDGDEFRVDWDFSDSANSIMRARLAAL